MRTIKVTRYVTPLREGGSLPAIVEAENDGQYVLKFRGAGQGPKALIAELIAGEIARYLGFNVPELVLLNLDPAIAMSEPDAEIQDLIKASSGINLGMDYLPGSITFDPITWKPDSKLASSIVWFDAFISNVDRTAKNANMLSWHGNTWLIDHGAALYFHHSWESAIRKSREPFHLIKDHIMIPFINDLKPEIADKVNKDIIESIVNLVPEEWLVDDFFESKDECRVSYIKYLTERVEQPQKFWEEAVSAWKKIKV